MERKQFTIKNLILKNPSQIKISLETSENNLQRKTIKKFFLVQKCIVAILSKVLQFKQCFKVVNLLFISFKKTNKNFL
jgi:hypothetical protein